MKSATLGFALLTIALAKSTPAAVLEIGKAAPDFSAVDSQGKTQTLEQYKGKFLVLEWTNPDCPFVQKHYGSGNMQATQAKARAMGAVWLSVLSSAKGNEGYMTPSETNAYRAKNNVKSNATILDPSGELGHLYRAKTTPQIAIIDPNGKLIYYGAIDDQPSPDPDTLTGAKNYAIAALKEAISGNAVTVSVTRSYGCSVKY